MNAYQMGEEVHVTRYVPTHTDHSTAAVSLDTIYQDMPAMVRWIIARWERGGGGGEKEGRGGEKEGRGGEKEGRGGRVGSEGERGGERGTG